MDFKTLRGEWFMGWGDCGEDSKGRRIGYLYGAKCDWDGCNEKIDRGLSYACGGMHGLNGVDCEGYFCNKHMTTTCNSDEHLCFKCALTLDATIKLNESGLV